MGVLGTIAGEIGSWFGFVGACVVSPAAACRPFLAFFALALSATVCLVVVVVALRAIWRNERRPAAKAARQALLRDTHERIEPVLSASAREDAAATTIAGA